MAWLPFQKLFAASDYVFQSGQHFLNKNAPNFLIKVNELAVGLFSKLKFELRRQWRLFIKPEKDKKDFSSFAGMNQTSANRDPNSRFVVKGIFKPLVPKSSRSSIIITQNCDHVKHKF